MSDDFLAREAAVLGSDFSSSFIGGSGNAGDIDFEHAAAAFPDIDLDGDFPVSHLPPSKNPQPSSDDFDFDFAKPAPPVKVTGDDEFDAFESQFPDIGGESIAAPPSFAQSPPSFKPNPAFQTVQNIPAPVSRQPSTLPPVFAEEDEPEVIRDWRRQQAETIAAREEAAEKKRQETISKAEQAIDQFYETYNSEKERNIKENKLNEAEYLTQLTDSLTAGTTWSRICDYIELQNSQSKTLARSGAGTTDLTRFKEVLLRLEREGEHAPGAAGY